MMFRSFVIAGAAVWAIGASPAFSQQSITENLNNTGIPRQAPALGLPSIYGLNPCSSGATLGVTTPLFGIGGAISDIDRECETRNNAAVVITGLKDEILGREILCEIKDIRQAAIRVGKPCLQDQPTVKVAAALPDKPAAPQPIVPAIAIPERVRIGAQAYCHVRDLELRLYPNCTTAPPTKVLTMTNTFKAKPVGAKPMTARPVEFQAMLKRVAFLQLDARNWGGAAATHAGNTGAQHRHHDCPLNSLTAMTRPSQTWRLA